MSSSFQTGVAELAGISKASSNSAEWDFQGKIIYTQQYANDFDADLAADLAQELSTATVKSGQDKKPMNVFTRPIVTRPRLSGTTCVSSSYADTEASMTPNYTAPSNTTTLEDFMSQYSTFIPTPTTSDDQRGEDKSFSGQNDSVDQQQQSPYLNFPTYIDVTAPLVSWYDEPHRHEYIAYKLSDPAADPIVQEKRNESKGHKVQKRK